MDAWVWWLIIAVLLAGAEAATTGMLLIMFSGGALAAALASALGVPVVGSAGVFAVVSIALIAFVRPVATRHMSQSPASRSGVAALVGTDAVVVEPVDGSGGRIRLAGEIWSARTLDETARYEAGERVHVFQIDGATAVVG